MHNHAPALCLLVPHVGKEVYACAHHKLPRQNIPSTVCMYGALTPVQVSLLTPMLLHLKPVHAPVRNFQLG